MNEMIMVCYSLNNNTRTGLAISLCLNVNPLMSLIPRMASNFRHLFSCGTVGQFLVCTSKLSEIVDINSKWCKNTLSLVSIARQMPRPRHKNKAIFRLSSHPSR